MGARKLLLYCDGSVRTGGRAGVGVVLADPDTGTPLKRFGEALDTPQSSNTAEYHALIRGLEEARRLGATEVEVYTDSSLVHGQIVLGWACNHDHLRQLRDQCLALLAQFQSWTLQRVESRFNPMAHTYATVASTQNRRNTNTTHKGGNTMILEFRDYEPLPTGSYHCVVVDVTVKNGLYGEQMQFTLEVVSGEHAGRQLKAWCNPSASTNSKLYRWARALLREPVTRLDTQQLVGKQCMAQVVQQQAGNGNIYSRVQELLPVKTAKPTETEDDGYDPFEDD